MFLGAILKLCLCLSLYRQSAFGTTDQNSSRSPFDDVCLVILADSRPAQQHPENVELTGCSREQPTQQPTLTLFATGMLVAPSSLPLEGLTDGW
jgi:hypothetical protein